jgi:hypothetical protein
MDLSLKTSELQLFKEFATRNILLTLSIALSIVGFFLLLFSTGAISSTEINDYAFALAEHQAAARQSEHLAAFGNDHNKPMAVTLEVLPSSFQPTTLLSVGLKFLIPSLLLSIIVTFRQFFYPICKKPPPPQYNSFNSADESESENETITHATWGLTGMIILSFISLLWSVCGIVVFVRFVKHFDLQACVDKSRINQKQNGEAELCYGSFLNVLCYVGDAVDCDLVEIGLLGFLSAVFLGASSSLALLISLVDIRLDSVREAVEEIERRKNYYRENEMYVDEDGDVRVEMMFGGGGEVVVEEESEEESEEDGEEDSLLKEK